MDDLTNINSLSTRLIAEEAVRRGISLRHLNTYRFAFALLEFSLADHTEYVYGQKWAGMPYQASVITEDKELTKIFLRRGGISVCDGRIFGRSKNDIDVAERYAASLGFPVVVKPLDGAHGEGVSVHVQSKEDVRSSARRALEQYSYFMVEKMFFGTEYRLIATRDTVVAAMERIPANVVGDGEHTIEELVAIKNADSRRGDPYTHALVVIEIDDVVRDYLTEQGFSLETVVDTGVQIFLRKTSNLSTGGDSVDVTDLVHETLRKLACRAVSAIPGLPYAGVDLMSNRPLNIEPDDSSYRVVEVNASPGISIHHVPYRGKPRNVAGAIVDVMFPETKQM